MSNLKTKVVEGLPLNYNSTDPKDFVEVLNKIADAMGGVSNMGVFAEITSVTQSNEMIAHVAEKYVAVSVKRYEKPHRDLVVTTNVADPYQFDLDTLVGKNGSNISSNLDQFLSKVEKPVAVEKKATSASVLLENEKSHESFWGNEEDEEKQDENLSVSDAFREVGKDFSSAFKETADAFKDAFKFK